MQTIKNFLQTCLVAAAVLAVAAGILFLPSAASDGARKGLDFCGQILIPSLFPFMVLSSFIVKSGLAARMSTVLEPITRLLFRLPGCTGATIAVSLIGGYPAGARGIKALLERGDITPKQGERMLGFSVGAGPAFVISVVGAGLLGSGNAGLVLFFSQIAASILIGMLSALFAEREKRSTQTSVKTSPEKIDASSALVESSADATAGMLNMCAFVILFSCLLTLMQYSGMQQFLTNTLIHLGISEQTARSILPILLEVTSGCSNAAQVGASPALISFGLGWAGACVHFQISASLTGIHFSRTQFTLMRFIHGLLAAGISYAVFSLFPQTAAVFSSIDPSVRTHLQYDFSSSTAGSIMLIFLCAAFLVSLSEGMDFKKRKC